MHSQGIAVGMATNIPPHNLVEVVSGLKALIDNPDISLAQLMTHIPGPDFPTGMPCPALPAHHDAGSLRSPGSNITRSMHHPELVLLHWFVSLALGALLESARRGMESGLTANREALHRSSRADVVASNRKPRSWRPILTGRLQAGRSLRQRASRTPT